MTRIDIEALASLRRQTRASVCAECGKCTSVCPLAACGSFSARLVACRHLDQELEGGGLGITRCLTCGTCDLRCPQGVRFAELVRGVRELAHVETPAADCPHGGALIALMRMMSEGAASQDRLGWLGDGLRSDPETGEVFLWAGCAVYYDAFFPELGGALSETSRATLRVLNALGVTPVVSADERCCGHDLLWNGDRQAFERLARHNADLVERSGAATLVTPCAECARTWRLDYEPFLKRPIRVVHLAELVAERLGDLRLVGSGADSVTFQDPCRLGRHLGVYEAPRQALAAVPGLEIREMPHAERTARCCAGGAWAHCDRHSKQIQIERLGEAERTGATTLVTACPKCRIHFDCAQRDQARDGHPGIAVRDLADVLAEALA